MKLRSIYLLCRENCNAIEGLGAGSISINGRNGMRVKGWLDALDAVEKLKTVPAFEKQVNRLLESIPSFYRTRDSFDVANDEWQKIIAAKVDLQKNMLNTIAVYESVGEDVQEMQGIDIKLPAFNDFSEFTNYINDLDFVLSKCPFLESKDEKLKFDNVDVGSTWLTFFVVTAVAVTTGSVLLNNLAAFVDKCIILRSHYLSVEKQKNDLELEKVTAEEKKTILKYLDMVYKKEIETEIEALEKITDYKVTDPEEKDRIKLSIDKMGILLERGLQIHASIDSPAEVKALFAPLEMKYLGMKDNQGLIEAQPEEE